MKRLATAALVLIGGALGQFSAVDGADGKGDMRAPALSFHAEATDPAYGSVDLQHLGAGAIRQLRRTDPSIAQWQRMFSVHVDDADWPASDALPAVLGQYEFLPDGVRFTPRYPPTKGLKYRANVDLSALVDDPRQSTPVALVFSVPRDAPAVSTTVDKVFPSSGALPENLLRFYVHFSAPMQRGGAREHIMLLGPDGREVIAAFLDATTELWDPAMQRLTVLLDPGRIKRDVGPNIELGPPLRQGGRYSLVIREGMSDAQGRPLLKGFSKSFRVTAAIREPIDPSQWTVDLPASGTRQSLMLSFPAPLDQALLARVIRLVDIDSRPITGHTEIDKQETRWTFTPLSAWARGPYQLWIGASLEDVSGNTRWAPFDADVRGDGAADGAETRLVLPILLCSDRRVTTADRMQASRPTAAGSSVGTAPAPNLCSTISPSRKSS